MTVKHPHYTAAEDAQVIAGHERGESQVTIATTRLPGRSVHSVRARLATLAGEGRLPARTAAGACPEQALQALAALDASNRLLRAMLLYGLKHGPKRTPEPGLLGLSMAQVRARAQAMGVRL